MCVFFVFFFALSVGLRLLLEPSRPRGSDEGSASFS